MSVLITGSSRGLGLDLGKLFLANNHEVVFHSRNDAQILKNNNIHSKKAIEVNFELSNFHDTQECLHELFKKRNSPNLIICNAGSSSFLENSEVDIQSWKNSFDNNFYSALNIINACKVAANNHDFKSTKQLHIICISSICGHEKIEGAPIQYSIAKAALNNMVKFYAKDLIKENIILNAIAPGNLMFPGSWWEKKFKSTAEQKAFLEKIPSGRFVETSEIFEIIKMISSNNFKSLIGQVVIVDGGQTASF